MTGNTELKNIWTALFKVPVPTDEQLALWLFRYDAAIVNEAIAQLATKYQKLSGAMDQDFMIRFASSVMNRLQKEQKEKEKLWQTK